MENKKIRYLSVCSGMEAATVAWHHMGWTPVGFSEIEPFPSQILKHHYPTITNYGDLTKFKEWNIQPGSVDLLVGGTPCQAFSVAGLRKGLDDPRGNLALTFLALADHLRPKYILWENVPGVLSSNKGEDFASFISALAELRYGFAWRVCDAQHYGVAQRRKRLFMLAIDGPGNWRTAAEILFERKSLFGDIAESDQEGEGTTSDAGASVETGGILWSGGDQANAERVVDKAGTLNCNKGQRGGYIVPNVVGSLCARDFKGVGNQYVQEGKCIVEGVPFRKSKRATSTTDNETWVEASSSNTLNNFDLGDTRTTHAVVQPIPIQDGREIEKKQNGMGVANEGDPAYTIDTTGSQSVGLAYPINTMVLGGRPDPVNDAKMTMGVGNNGDPQFTLQAAHSHAVAYSIREDAKADNFSATPLEVTPALQAVRPSVQSHHAQTFIAEGVQAFDAYNQSVSNTSQTLSCSASDVNHTGAVFSPTMAVRRLTPRECERLQGFPDDYSMIPWKGKQASECPDGPRYKACGNSMAVPVMRWIGERIQKQIDGTL
jgi:DNA (cytosine-5)-methyltransferase 1